MCMDATKHECTSNGVLKIQNMACRVRMCMYTFIAQIVPLYAYTFSYT